MSKYDGLAEYLKNQRLTEVPMTFAEIERVTGVKLPPKAQHYRAWWSNNPSNNVMTQVWLRAGYESTQVDMAARKLVFRRIARNAKTERGSGGIAQRAPIRAAASGEAKHALVGALRGTFSIEPGYDLTRPALDPEELTETDRNLDRTADLINKSGRGSRS